MTYSANILIVDDEGGMLTTLAGIISENGYQIFSCLNGTEALKYLVAEGREAPIDLIISDLNLPDISGLEILKTVKEINPDIAFILITGHGSVESAIEALNKGAFAYHTKPLDIDVLNNSVDNALKQQRLQIENRRLIEVLQQSNTELKQSEIKYRTVVEQAADGIFIVEPRSGCFIEVNPRMEALTGYSREELLKMIVPMLHPEVEQVRAMEVLQRTLEHGQATADYLPFQKSSGEMVFIDLNSKLVEYQGEKVILGIVRDITERRQAEELVRQANLKLKEMRHFQALQVSREEERKRLAGELHDETMAAMASLAIELTLLKGEAEGRPELEAGLVEAREKVRDMDRRLREIVQGIYPSILSDMGLLPAINSYLKQLASYPINNPYPIEVTLRAIGLSDEQRLPEAVEIGLYRTIQQGMANVIAHAQASKVAIELSWKESEVDLAIADNGKGFDPGIVEATPLSGHFGLASLRYRAEGLGGTFEIESWLDGGVTLRSRIPTQTAGAGCDEVQTATVVILANEGAEIG